MLSYVRLLQLPFTVAPSLDTFEGGPFRLGLAGKHQQGNAALAVQLCRIWAQRSPLPRSAESDAQELASSPSPGAARTP